MKTEEIQTVIDQINTLLATLPKHRDVDLYVELEGTKFEDDWLYVCVDTNSTSVRVSDFAEALSEIERELRRHGVDNVLLVPARAG